MSTFLNELKGIIENQYASIADDGIMAGDVTGYISTGSYMLNALLGGSLFTGLAGNKITTLAGEESTGKTWLAIDICRNFLEENKDGSIIYFESESAVSKEMFRTRGIDTKRVLIVPVETVQQFRTQILKILDNYLEIPVKSRPPMLFVLDSLGMLSTTKEVEDTASGKETVDMTRAKMIRATFRTITLKLGIAGVPLILTNHTYDEQGAMYPRKILGGGKGIAYASSAIVFLSKRKEKDGTDVIGNIITCTLQKGRLTKENSKCEILLNYNMGMHKYHGLLDLGLKYGIINKVGNKYEIGDGKYFEKAIMKDPERFFTEELLLKLDDAARKEYCYGTTQIEEEQINEEEYSDDTTE